MLRDLAYSVSAVLLIRTTANMKPMQERWNCSNTNVQHSRFSVQFLLSTVTIYCRQFCVSFHSVFWGWNAISHKDKF